MPSGRKEGIKAILVYPMNALAMDQARRIAQAIDGTPSLHGRVSAGLYVGESERTPHTTMGPDHVITDRGTLRERSPDILPTNYKMLDFLLIRPIDHRLWRHNAPDTLRYLVLDELHTFDGAQGTDLACLIRRLRSRLGVARERLICAGTSATIGGEESREELLDYVSRIFDQPFEPDAIVGEVRQGIDEFPGRSLISRSLLPRDDLSARVDHTGYTTVESYVRAQHEVFFGESVDGDIHSADWRVALAQRLREHLTFVNLLRVLEGRPKSLSEIVERLRRVDPPGVFLNASAVLERQLTAFCLDNWVADGVPAGGGAADYPTTTSGFARNLATDIENNLRSICSPEEMNRIEVTNLDRWVVRFLRGKRYEFRVEFGRNREAWQKALDLKPPELDLSDSFYEDEWEQVIQAKGVVSEQEYRHVPRVGRGTRLGRGARVRVWPVFEEYRAQLAERGLKEVDDTYRDAAALLGADSAGSGYAAVVVDEAQDMGAQAFSLIRAIAPAGRDDLFIVGDGHQRIYGRNRVVMGRCGIDIRGRSRKLRLNYRTTEETRRWAAHILAGSDIDDLDGGSDDNQSIRSLTRGPEPVLERFDTQEEQIEFLMRYLAALQTSGEALRAVCIVARTTGEREAIKQRLLAQDVEVEVIDRDTIDDASHVGVRLATMHRVKGLEFERVVIASKNEGLVPLSAAITGKGDDTARDSAETEERSVVYVAATRAKKELLVLSYGTPSPYFGEM